MSELSDAIEAYSAYPCPLCRDDLGHSWREIYDPETDRLVKVHPNCDPARREDGPR